MNKFFYEKVSDSDIGLNVFKVISEREGEEYHCDEDQRVTFMKGVNVEGKIVEVSDWDYHTFSNMEEFEKTYNMDWEMALNNAKLRQKRITTEMNEVESFINELERAIQDKNQVEIVIEQMTKNLDNDKMYAYDVEEDKFFEVVDMDKAFDPEWTKIKNLETQEERIIVKEYNGRWSIGTLGQIELTIGAKKEALNEQIEYTRKYLAKREKDHTTITKRLEEGILNWVK